MLDISHSTVQRAPADRAALVQAILDLQRGQLTRIADPGLAYELAFRVKPYVDQLVGLKSASGQDEASPWTASEEVIPALEDTEPAQRRPAAPGRDLLAGPEMSALSADEQARWIFMDRFICLERHQQILRYQFAAADVSRHQVALARLMDELLLLPDAAAAAATGIPALQQLFAAHVLLLRHPFVGDGQGNPIPCTLERLREFHPEYFYRRSRTPNWYERWELYTEPMQRTGWVLLDTEYLNCTLRSPAHRLQGYARRWQVACEQVVQKTVVEDVYDRILCGEAVGRNLFEQNCSSCTATSYGPDNGTPVRWAHTVQHDGKIAVHGRPGVPHWRATRRLWPGVFPVILFP
ncbi:MAG: hypothetical protein AB1505_29225 [Candidatus Latescibacterota bacterium]